MNPGVREWLKSKADLFVSPILEVGGLNENGSVREYVPVDIVTDMRDGRGVDVVCRAEDLIERFGEGSFQTVVSTEAFEHMENWRACLRNMWGVLKDDGWLVLTMAGINKRYHGYPDDYWRMHQEHSMEVFGVPFETLGNISVGWTLQKTGPLRDLSKVRLLRIAKTGVLSSE